MSDHATTGVGWDSVVFLLAIVLFGVIRIGHVPIWHIYVTILAWWGFVIWEITQNESKKRIAK